MSAVFGVAVLVAVTVFAAVDRQILILLAEPMRATLGMNDTQVGLVQGAGVALFAGLGAVPLGWLADRWGRRATLVACVLLWAAATAACGAATSFAGLLVSAVGLGIGEAGLAPIVYGLLPDIVPAHRRVLANGVYALATIVGAGLGIGLAGLMLEHVSQLRPLLPEAWREVAPWRLAFLGVALPAPLLALAVALLRVRRPSPSTVEAAPAADLRGYLRHHGIAATGVFVGTGLAMLGLAAMAAWVPVIASRRFGQVPADVGQAIGAAYLAGTALGAALGALAMRGLVARVGAAAPLRITAAGMVLAAATALALPIASGAEALYALFALQVSALIAGTVLMPTLLQDLTPPALRSRVIALGSVAALGMSALSPVLVGVISDAQGARIDALPIAVAAVSAAALGLGALVLWRTEPPFVRTVRSLRIAAPLQECP